MHRSTDSLGAPPFPAHREEESVIVATEGRNPRRPDQGCDRRAAAKLIESVGANGFSLRKLAKALGVGPTTIHFHFEGGVGAVSSAVAQQALAGGHPAVQAEGGARRLPCRIAPQDNGGAARSTGRRQARRSLSSHKTIASLSPTEFPNLTEFREVLNAGMGSPYRSQYELLPLFKNGSAPHVNNVELSKRGRWRSNVWTYPGASSLGSDARRGLEDHPTVKPTAMLEDALLDLTDRGDIVIDPFLGSGPTLIAAEKTGRVCRGVELDPLYVNVIVRRFEAATGISATLVETGETFQALAVRREREAAELTVEPASP